ncbi:SQUALENE MONOOXYGENASE [Salix koriyanagi]|uniref:Squalene monooxygenase n=1 Tax=Salix koriyanagi TaxID=2511006 RepID=A0A9Q0W6Q4_9ROSI|nr:SQUALENE MONOOXYGENASE [Salix koriyanagi]
MDSKHIFGGVVSAFLFGFVVLYSSRRREKIKASEKTRTKKKLKSSGNGVCRSNFAGNTDVVIVGAGVAGSALAYALAKLGLEDCLDGSDSQTVFSFAAVHKDGKRSAISYPSNASGRGFHHGRFVQKLREKAASLPNVELEQGTVTSLVEENGSIKEAISAVQRLKSHPTLSVWSWKIIIFHMQIVPIEVPSYSVGLVLEDYNLPYANRAYFILKDTIAIAYPISSKEIRCLVDVPGPQPPSISTGEMASYLKTVVAPQMPPELHNAFICAIDKGNIRTMPNRIMPASSYPTPGAFLIGDSLNMRHSVTGGGMTVGLSDVVLLRDLLRPLNDLSNAASVCKYLESFCVLRKPTAFAINTLASTLHTVFSSSDQDPARKEMKEAFFNYLSLGGVFSDGLMALLSGLNPDPLSLFFHCFAMLAYAVGSLLLPFPTPKRMCIAARLVLVGSGIIFPILKAEGIRATFFPATMPAYYRTPPAQSTDHREAGK